MESIQLNKAAIRTRDLISTFYDKQDGYDQIVEQLREPTEFVEELKEALDNDELTLGEFLLALDTLAMAFTMRRPIEHIPFLIAEWFPELVSAKERAKIETHFMMNGAYRFWFDKNLPWFEDEYLDIPETSVEVKVA